MWFISRDHWRLYGRWQPCNDCLIEIAKFSFLHNCVQCAYIHPWAQLGWGHGGCVPHFFRQWGYNMPFPLHFLFRFCNILVSHHPVPPHFTTKFRPCVHLCVQLLRKSTVTIVGHSRSWFVNHQDVFKPRSPEHLDFFITSVTWT